MASKLSCDPCASEDKTSPAIRFCSDCEEQLCQECAEFHTRFKAFKLHHIVKLESLKYSFPVPNKHCEIHSDILLEFFCTQHEVTCCRVCIADSHRSCDKILPLDIAAKDIKTSSLLQDSLSSVTDTLTTLEKLLINREGSLMTLKEAKTKVIQQISNAKLKLLKQLDEAEQKLIDEVSTIEKTNETEIVDQKSKLSNLKESFEKTKEDMEFLKDNGSNTQVFLKMHQSLNTIAETEATMKKMTSCFIDIDIEFHERKDNKILQIGSVSEIKKQCKIELTQRVIRQAQIKTSAITRLREFEMKGSVPLKSDKTYDITSLDITHDNKLLVSNFKYQGSLLIYKDCTQYENEISFSSPLYAVTVIPGTDTAVVTLPDKNSLQFIDTTNLTKGDKINIGMRGYGVTATRDRIFVGGRGVVKILDSKGSSINSVKVGSGYIDSLCLDKDKANILCRCDNSLFCCKEDGTVIYQYEISGAEGIAVDIQGNVYVSMSETKEIHRLSPDGKFIDAISTGEEPGALTLNNDGSQFFVVLNHRRVIVFKYK